jgi:energy-converting hydrogenase Eha subunit E
MVMSLVYFSHYNLLKILVFVAAAAMMPVIVHVALRILKKTSHKI